ncbi:hypothetical protein ABT093_39385 [Kitasatospora sp. NPDC002551]|uniref:hypothetical protein n=1 Tax=Kitasatospora sp. NPDC002551 TaxID=3154539 RepID=UPI00332E523A
MSDPGQLPVDLEAALVARARGAWSQEAAVWLLTGNGGMWLPRLEVGDFVKWIGDDRAMAYVDWPAVWEVLDEMPNEDASGPLRAGTTTSQLMVLRIAGALDFNGCSAVLAHQLPGLNEHDTRRVLHAMAWSARGRSYAEALGVLTA